MSKKVIKVAVVGGAGLKVTDKRIQQMVMHLTEHKAQEVIITGNGGGSLIAEKAAYELGIPNVLLLPAAMVERADILFTMPGGTTTQRVARMFMDQKKPVVIIVGND